MKILYLKKNDTVVNANILYLHSLLFICFKSGIRYYTQQFTLLLTMSLAFKIIFKNTFMVEQKTPEILQNFNHLK